MGIAPNWKRSSVTKKRQINPNALEIDFSDSDTQIAAAGLLLGAVLGFCVPIFYTSRDEADEKRMEYIRALNRATKEAKGEYMSEDDITRCDRQDGRTGGNLKMMTD